MVGGGARALARAIRALSRRDTIQRRRPRPRSGRPRPTHRPDGALTSVPGGSRVRSMRLDSTFVGKFRGALALPEKPFRDQLLSVERLDERARSLAARFTVDPSGRKARSVFPRFDDNVRVLREAYRALAGAVHRREFVTAASEWLLDNYHLVASEIRDVRQNLPRGYYRELPKLAAREQAGDARVYALAVELIRHSDSRLDRAQLVRWLDAFQTVAPLTIGELWAWPSMLTLALVENLRR